MKDYIVLDLEMTGLNPRIDAILEIGAVKIREGQPSDTFSRMICPHREISQKVQEITGITDQIAALGEEIDPVMEEFTQFWEDDVILGHNIIFDYSFLKQWAINHKITMEKMGMDTLKIARICLPQLEKRSLDYLCDYYGIRRKASHRAFEDAKATGKLYEILKEEFQENNPELFIPKLLNYKAKRQTGATERQKNYLKELAEYHRIELEPSLESLTRSQASKLTDQLISRFGRMNP